MAAIENEATRKSNHHGRSNKNSTRVDLTPMVDLGFLLITFFVFTTQLSIPTTLNLNMPYDKVDPGDKVCASCVLTLVLDAGNTIKYYEGMAASNPEIMHTDFSTAGIRNVILEKKRYVQKIRGSEDDFVLIIKSSAGATFQNFVDIVDEVAINQVKHYYLDELTDADKKMFLIK
jgi:biopolymer transport protein ExbD